MAPDGTGRLGTEVGLGRFTFTAEEIVRFARRYDPQPFHVDAVAAARSPYGCLIASGWHTVCVWMGLFVRAHGPVVAALEEGPAERAEVIAPVGVGFGLTDLRWREPVRAGDEIVFATVLEAARASTSRPGWAVYRRRALATRPDGTPVAGFCVSHMAPMAVALEPWGRAPP